MRDGKLMATTISAEAGWDPRAGGYIECPRCLISSAVPGAGLDQGGECAYCRLHDRLAARYPIDCDRLARLFGEIKLAGQGKPYDCLIGISGGVDSSFLLHLAVEHGLRPLAVHADNGFDKPEAIANMEIICRALAVDRIVYQVGGEEYRRLCWAFLYASVSDADIPNDIAMTALIMRTAERYGIKYVLNGHDFRTEATCPLGWTYMDGRYIRDVYRLFGQGWELERFPNLTFSDQLRWAMKGIKQVRPFYYCDFDREAAAAMLADRYGWQSYGAKHAENTYTEFIGYYYLPRKFGIDKRILYLSALVRSGKMEKEAARKALSRPPDYPDRPTPAFLRSAGIGEEELGEIMRIPRRTYREFDTYLPLFRRYRRLIRLGSRLGLLPETFAEKYTRGE